MSPRVAVVTCVWQRPRLTIETIGRWREAFPSWTRIFVAGSPGDGFLPALADDYARFPNAPLSAKWEGAFGLARAYRPEIDAVMILGSDDWLPRHSFDALVEAGMRDGYAGPSLLYVHDLRSQCTTRLDGYAGDRRYEPMGAGRVLRADVLDALDWSLWPKVQIDRCLDRYAHERILTRAPDFMGPLRVPILDVKDPHTQLTPWRSFVTLPRVPAVELDRAIGYGTTQSLITLRRAIMADEDDTARHGVKR